MSKFLSGRQSNLNLGISSTTENKTVLQTIGKVGIGTTTAQQYSLYVVGPTNITGDVRVGGASTFVGVGTFNNDLYVANQLYAGGINITNGASLGADIVTRNLLATGISTFTGQANANGGLDVTGHTELDNLNVSGIATINNLNVQTGFDVYDTQAVFHNNVRIEGNLSIGGTATVITAQDLKVFDKEITLGVTTNAFGQDVSTDDTANHGGIAIASTEGSPLVSLKVTGINTMPDTYKQIMWVKHNTMGAGTTDAWLFNYAVGIGSTLVPNGVRLAVGGVQITNDTVYTKNLNVTGLTNVGVVSAISVNATGIITANSFRPSSGFIQAADGTNSLYIYNGSGNVAFQGTIGASSINNGQGYQAINFTTTSTPTVIIPNNLTVSGLSTFVGIGTFNSDLYVGGSLYANALSITGGSSVGADIETRNLRVTGLSTFVGVGTFNTDLYVGGSLYANALSITGGSSVGVDINTRNLNVTGVSTFVGVTTSQSTIFANQLSVLGLSTFIGIGTFRSDLYVGGSLYANVLSITGGSSVGADINTRNLNVTGVSTFIGVSTFANNVSIAGTLDVNGNINFNGNLFQNNQPFVASRWSAGDGTNIYRLSNVGIGTTNPSQDLDVLGDVRIRGGIYDRLNSSGSVNNVLSSDGAGGWNWISVQQAGAGTIDGITILEEGSVVGTANSVRSINFVGRNVTATAAGYGSTITFTENPVYDTLGVSGLSTFFSNVGIGTTNPQFNLDVLGDINFTGGLYQNSIPFVASRWTVGTGSSIYRVSNVGIGTTNPGYTLEVGPVGYAGTSLWVNGDTNITGIVRATAYYGSGVNLTDLIQTINLTKLEGLNIKEEGSQVGTGATFVTLNFIGSNITATGIGSTANITLSETPTFQSINVSGITTTNSLSIGSTQVISSGRQLQNIVSLDATTTATIEAAIQAAPNTFNDLNIVGVSTFNQVVLNNTVSAGSTVGSTGQYLQSTGVGVTWASFPSLRTSQTFTATANQTSFSFTYNINYIDVYVNGVKLATSEYTANNGTTVVLTTPAFVGDIVELISYNTLSTGGGGGGGGGTVTALNDLSDVVLSSENEGDVLVYSGSTWVNDHTISTTTTSTSQTTLHSLDITIYRSVEYTVQATRGSSYHTTKILTLHDGTLTHSTEYGSVYTNTPLGTFTTDVSGGYMRLLVTSSNSTSTTYKVKFTAIKI